MLAEITGGNGLVKIQTKRLTLFLDSRSKKIHIFNKHELTETLDLGEVVIALCSTVNTEKQREIDDEEDWGCLEMFLNDQITLS